MAAHDRWLTSYFDATGVSPKDVAAAFDVRAGALKTRRRIWYDTFDWRLWSDGLVLEVDTNDVNGTDGDGGDGFTASLRNADDSALQWVQAVTAVPRRADELPPGPWRRSLAKALTVRALVPVAAARVRSTTLELTDEQGKTVAEVIWEEATPAPPDDEEDGHDDGATPVRTVRVVPLRGHATAAKRAARRLRDAGLVPRPAHPLQLVAAAERQPGAYSTKLAVALDPTQPAADAVSIMLAALFDTMQVNEPWLFDPPDTEFLHDYRVALRRSRSVLKQARGIVAPAVLDEWRPRLRDLQQRSNWARDLDVFLLEFDDYRAAVPEAFRTDLDPLHTLLRRHRAREQKALIRYLESRAHRDLTDGYAELMAAPLSTDDAPEADRAVATVAADRIGQALRRVLRRGRRITDASPPTDLHDLRIAGKELRYALETYASLYRADTVEQLERELKRLQDNLGEFQDGEVHAAALTRFAEELESRGKGKARTLMAIGLLAETFSVRQAEARASFADRFGRFTAAKNLNRFDTLLASGSTM